MLKKLVSYEANGIRRLGERKTDARFSFLKALGIFFVVYGHVGPAFSLFAEEWFPQGPMKLPLFVFVSGFFYSAFADDAPFRFLLKRAKRLLLPYFIWNLFYGVLCAVLRNTGVIDFGIPLGWRSLFWAPFLNGHQFGFNIAAWFLPALFLVSAFYALLRFLLKKLHILSEWALLVFFFLLSWGAVRFAQAGFDHGAWLILIRTAYFLAFFQLGRVMKVSLSDVKIPAVPFFIGVFLLVAANRWFLGPTGAVTVWCAFTGSAAGHLVSVTLSILFWYKVADFLAPALERLPALLRVGENTFSVMMHHGLVLFCINCILLGLSRAGFVSEFDEAAFREGIWYAAPLFNGGVLIFYVAACIAVPCLLRRFWEKGLLFLDERLQNKDKR